MGIFIRAHRALVAGLLLLSAVSAAQAQTTVTVAWDRNADSVTAGYRIDYGTATGSYQWSLDVGNQTSASLALSPGSVYYLVVRGYDSSYQYGPPSAEVTINLATPALPTARISATLQTNSSALVSWETTNAAAATINGYAVAASGSTTVMVSATTTFTLVATSSTGAIAAASATVTLNPGPPTAPVSLSASVSGARVSLTWLPPTGGGAPHTYLVYAGTSPGATDVANGVAVGNVLGASANLPRGRYYIRVKAANADGISADSNTVTVRVARQLAAPGGSWTGATTP